MPGHRKPWAVAGALAAVLSPPPAFEALAGGPPAGGEYVADRECAGCHRQIYRSYQAVGMARSFSRPGDAAVIEDFEHGRYFHEPSGRHYQMIRRDDGYVLRRYQLDDQGREINLFEQPVTWIIGSGEHSRGYLYRTPPAALRSTPGLPGSSHRPG